MRKISTSENRATRALGRPSVCLFDGGSRALDETAVLLKRCGLQTWTFDASDVHEQLAAHPGTLCLIIDLPDTRGLTLLELLRMRAVSLPAILVADGAALPSHRLTKACVLDTLARPVAPREIFAWIECIVLASNAMDGIRARAAARRPYARAEVIAQPAAEY